MRGAFSEIVALAKDRSVAGRRRLATQFGQAFFTHATDFSNEERGIALDIMMALLRDAELEIRRELSELLSHEPTAPRRVIRTLAEDVIEVARPVLLHSPVLTEEDLLDIISAKATEHRVAIANREQLPEKVTGALASVREPEVSEALLQNIALHLPEGVIETLAQQAADRFDLAELLVNRAEVTSDLAAHLYWSVSQELRKHIRHRFDLSSQTVEAALEETVSRLSARDDDPAARRSLADRLLKSGVISPGWMTELLRCRSLPLFREVFAGMTKLSPAAVEAVLQPEASDALALVCRALDFSKAETGSLLMLVRERINNKAAFNPAELADALATYGRLTAGDAKTVLWQWQNDPSYLMSLTTRLNTN